MKLLLEGLVAVQLPEGINVHIVKVDNCPSNVEKGGSKEEADAAMAKAKMEHDATIRRSRRRPRML